MVYLEIPSFFLFTRLLADHAFWALRSSLSAFATYVGSFDKNCLAGISPEEHWLKRLNREAHS